MVALTQEKREELANYAEERLASHVKHGGCSDEEEIFKIALASLTAECKYFQWKWVRDESAVWTTTPIEKLSDAVSAFGEDGENVTYRMLFTAPPVQEIKLPSRIENIHLRTPLEVEDMWIDRFKRLNGWGE